MFKILWRNILFTHKHGTINMVQYEQLILCCQYYIKHQRFFINIAFSCSPFKMLAKCGLLLIFVFVVYLSGFFKRKNIISVFMRIKYFIRLHYDKTIHCIMFRDLFLLVSLSGLTTNIILFYIYIYFISFIYTIYIFPFLQEVWHFLFQENKILSV